MSNLVIGTGRSAMVAIGNLYAAHANQFNYSEAADRAEIFDLTLDELIARLEAGESITGDCSSTAEATAKDAGIPLGPLGYTGSELEKMPHITLAEAKIGDFIVFGSYPGKHVVWITETSPTNPKIDSHGEPGFQQTYLQDMWNSVFAGQPITVLSLEPWVPKPTPPADPYHYLWFDNAQIKLSTGMTTSERESVQHYDEQRPDPAKNQTNLLKIEENLFLLSERLQSIMKTDNDPKGLKFHRAWRLEQLKTRSYGTQVVK